MKKPGDITPGSTPRQDRPDDCKAAESKRCLQSFFSLRWRFAGSAGSARRLFEAGANDLDDAVLLVGGHLVVGRQAQAALEDVGAYVGCGACDVGVGLRAAIALRRDERVVAVVGLQVHGLPDGTAFGVDRRNGVENLLGAGLSWFGGVKVVVVAADLGTHGIRID